MKHYRVHFRDEHREERHQVVEASDKASAIAALKAARPEVARDAILFVVFVP